MIKDSVIVIDADTGTGRLIEESMKGEGFDVLVLSTGKNVIQIIEERCPQVIILNIILPDSNGFELLKKVRNCSSVPVVILSERNDIDYKISGLQLGADDYITKPFHLEELIARVQAVLRRTRRKDTIHYETYFNSGELFIDYEKRKVLLNNTEIQFTPLEYLLLTTLTLNNGKILTHQYLLQNVWGAEYQSEREYLHVYIGQIRSKIESDPKKPEYIITVPRVGYLFKEHCSNI